MNREIRFRAKSGEGEWLYGGGISRPISQLLNMGRTGRLHRLNRRSNLNVNHRMFASVRSDYDVR